MPWGNAEQERSGDGGGTFVNRITSVGPPREGDIGAEPQAVEGVSPGFAGQAVPVQETAQGTACVTSWSRKVP